MALEGKGELPDVIAGHALSYAADHGGYFSARLWEAAPDGTEIVLSTLLTILGSLRKSGVRLLLVGNQQLALDDGGGLLVHDQGVSMPVQVLPSNSQDILIIRSGTLAIRGSGGKQRKIFPVDANATGVYRVDLEHEK